MDRENNWFEKILAVIPGYQGYRDREASRETDAVLRRAIAEQLDQAKHRLNDVITERTQAGDLASLDAIGRAQSRLGGIADTLRTAARGSSGWLDDYQIDQAVLNQIHAADEALTDSLSRLDRAFAEYSGGETVAPLLEKLEAVAAEIREGFSARNRLLTGAPDLTDHTEGS